jgi:serine/threonine protein kinase
MMTPNSPHEWARVKELFHAAVEREPADRSGYLTAACGTDAVLRAEVERLLAAHIEAADFIEWPTARLTGRQIGRYQIGELIGQGGMGEVYDARDTELGRDVALKVGRSTGEESRLRREAQHASRLNHPNICTIHEVGVVDGRRYIVMERVEGRQLSDVIPPEGLSTNEVLRYGVQVADAVAHAHRHGVIHRDLKPANIVVTPEQRVKVLDFGLSQILPMERLKAATVAQTTVTREGMIAGTLSYMAPELLRGEQADERTDIWALGVLLYEMASGTRPFRGATQFELCASILHEPPAPMPAAVLAPLQHVIRQCLAADPRERYQNASDIKAALEAIEGERVACLLRCHDSSRAGAPGAGWRRF